MTNIFLVRGFQFLRSHLWFNNQLIFYIVGSSKFVPSTFNVPMFKDHESIVVVVKNRKRKQAEYVAHCKFKNIWVIKYILGLKVLGVKDGLISIVRCRVCTRIEFKEKLLVLKMDSLSKHVGK